MLPILAFVALSIAITRGATNPLDLAIERALAGLVSPVTDAWMRSATFIGEYGFTIPCAAALALVAWMQYDRRASIILAVDTVSVICVNVALKLSFSRARPTLFSKVALPTTYSYPSGHSMAAVGIWGVMTLVAMRLVPAARVPILTAGAVLVISIGVSRFYLGVHWPADVVGAFLAGTPFLLVSHRLLKSAPNELSRAQGRR